MMTYCIAVKKSPLQSSRRFKDALTLALCLCSSLTQGSEHCENSSNHWFISIVSKKSNQELPCNSKALLDLRLDSAYQQTSEDDILFRKSLDQTNETHDQFIFDSEISRYSNVSGSLRTEDIETVRGFKTLK